MSVLKAFRLSEDLVKKLAKIAKATHRSEKYYVTAALTHYLEDYYEAQIAKDRFSDPKSRIISSQDMKKRLDV